MQKGELDYESELKQLEKEGEMPLDELIASLPPEILEQKEEAMATEESVETSESKKEKGSGDKTKTSTKQKRYYMYIWTNDRSCALYSLLTYLYIYM